MGIDWLKWVNTGAGLYSTYRQGQNANNAGRQAGDVAARQHYYDTQLRGLLANPGSIRDDPGFQSAFEGGRRAIERTSSAKGYLGSGNEADALFDFGSGFESQYYNQRLAFLSDLSGAKAANSPAQGYGTAQQGYGQASNTLDSVLGSLGYDNPGEAYSDLSYYFGGGAPAAPTVNPGDIPQGGDDIPVSNQDMGLNSPAGAVAGSAGTAAGANALFGGGAGAGTVATTDLGFGGGAGLSGAAAGAAAPLTQAGANAALEGFFGSGAATTGAGAGAGTAGGVGGASADVAASGVSPGAAAVITPLAIAAAGFAIASTANNAMGVHRDGPILQQYVSSLGGRPATVAEGRAAGFNGGKLNLTLTRLSDGRVVTAQQLRQMYEEAGSPYGSLR